MIEIQKENNRNLKNVKQIGTPREENKIYIENMTYNKIKEDSYREKRVFVLMGHTERMEGRYATFVEGAIPVREIEFIGSIPKWNNVIWSEVFREIKRQYEDMIIVGWALDVKGMSPKMTPDLERVHREHFGGVHQLAFLLDTLEQEEIFYIYKENKLVLKDGFYIYHKARSRERGFSDASRDTALATMVSENGNGFRRIETKVDVEVEVPENEILRGGKYRKLMQEQKKPEKDNGNIGVAIAVAMLVFIIGVSVYENSGAILSGQNSVETNMFPNQNTTESREEKEELGTELDEEGESSKNRIEVEVIPGSE